MDHDAEAAVSGGEKELRGQRSLKAKVFDESDEIEEEGGKDGEKVGNQGRGRTRRRIPGKVEKKEKTGGQDQPLVSNIIVPQIAHIPFL
jgi:hypothetical protein